MRFRLSRRFPWIGTSATETSAHGAGSAAPADPGGGDETELAATPDTTQALAPPPADPTGPTSPASTITRVVVPRWVQLVMLPLFLLALWSLARAAGTVLLILVAASTFALILNPLVKMLQRRRVPRGLAILLVYAGLLGALVGIGVLLANPVSTQISDFKHNLPSIIKQANHDLANIQNWLNRHGLKIQIKRQGQTALQTLQNDVTKATGNLASFARDLLGKLVTLAFDLVLVVVLSVYLLVYGRQIGDLVRRIMPPGDGSPDDDFPVRVQRAVFAYVRGQLLFSLIMGTSAGFCLWLIGIIGVFPDGAHYALFFGGFYGVMELIPYLGPILGAAPPVLVALFNDPITALWVTLLFVALQQLEGHIVAPQVFRLSLRINPILIILSLLIGYQLYGIAGALVALPVVAVIRETIIYLRRHLVLEPWGTPSASALEGPPHSGSEAVQARDARARPPEGGAPETEGGVLAGGAAGGDSTNQGDLPTEPEVPVGR
jgi:predicted PurR-regulated permease PerM